MALVLADRVKETTTTTGTGTVTLLGAATGFQSFAVVGNGNTTYYTIASQTNSEWEVGIGTYTASGTTLARTTVLSSSNSGSLVNFSAGTKDVFVTYPSSRSIYADGTTLTATNSSVLPTASGGTGTTSTTFTNLTTNVTGTLPIANGGTGATTLAGANIAVTNAAQTFTGGQRGAVTALTSSSASIAINLATNCNFSYTTTENSTLAAPSNPVAGQSGVIIITQGATPYTLAYNTFYKFAGGTVPTLTATASAVDTFAYYVESATRATCQLIKDVK